MQNDPARQNMPPMPPGGAPPAPPQGGPPQGGMPPQRPMAPPMGAPGAVNLDDWKSRVQTVSGIPNDEKPLGPRKTVEDLHIDELLNIVVDMNASDLHICQLSPPVIRHDGKLKRLNYDSFIPENIQRMMYEIVSDDQVQRFETIYELDFSYALPIPFNQRVPGGPTARARFRVNLYRDKGSVAAAFRLISSKIPTVEDLKLPLILKSLTEKPRGLVLVTGPTGSGKSTSLAAMINHINLNHAHHIITIEDPIEYLHEHKLSVINQRELGMDTKSFANSLRACLREDPDILLVGEMRDVDTIQLAITAAETGHLVFATLHTNNAAESVDRMIDVFPPGQQEQIRVQLSNNLVAIISQQLLPHASGKGRVPANEVMVASPAIRNLIREAKTHQITSMIQTSANMGMFTMDQCLRDLYLKGWVTLDDIMSRCTNVEELKKMLATSQGTAAPGQAPSNSANNMRR
jgi:twitching motility protein PilT